jgi:ferredoxin
MSEGSGRLDVRIERELCTGSGVCIAYAPATFAHDAETKAVVLDPAGDSGAAVRAAAEGCPTGAIVVSDEEGA